jgi:hypothetical protein
MKVIKYVLNWRNPTHRLILPKRAQILSVQVEVTTNCLCLWALVNTRARKCSRVFAFYETGIELPPKPGRHVATTQVRPGYVVHIFEVTK